MDFHAVLFAKDVLQILKHVFDIFTHFQVQLSNLASRVFLCSFLFSSPFLLPADSNLVCLFLVATELLQRFIAGGGRLWDLEFLNNDQGRRVAAFGRSAGAVGMALGYWLWANKVLGTPRPLEPMTRPYVDYKALAVDVKKAVDAAVAKIGYYPRPIIIGALGRCGQGAIEFSTLIDAAPDTITKWDLEETRPGGPFTQILDHDIMLNCIYLSSPIPPFINKELIEKSATRKLIAIVDVSCDASNPHNPIPLYNTFVCIASSAVAPFLITYSILFPQHYYLYRSNNSRVGRRQLRRHCCYRPSAFPGSARVE